MAECSIALGSLLIVLVVQGVFCDSWICQLIAVRDLKRLGLFLQVIQELARVRTDFETSWELEQARLSAN